MFVRHCNLRRIALRTDGWGAFSADTQALYDMWLNGYAHGAGNGYMVPQIVPAFDYAETEF
jgi:hypothetical protein